MQVSEIHVGKRAMVDCIADIEVWCRSHGLKLNTDKSNVIWLDAKQQLSRMSQADKDLHLPSGTLQASETARNLGVIDQQLTFDAHARACSRACFYHLRHIRQIRSVTAATGPRVYDVTSGLLQRSVCELQRGRSATAATNAEQRSSFGLLRTSL